MVPSPQVTARAPVDRREARPQDADGLAVELGERPALARGDGGEAPRLHLPVDLGRRPLPVDPDVVRTEEPGVAGQRLVLVVPRIPAFETGERAWKEIADEPCELRPELVVRVLLAEWQRRLREHRPGVELGVHPVEREADLVVAVSNRPRHRARPAVARQKRRVAVHRAEPRHGQRVRRDLPREPEAEERVGLVRSEERRNALTARGHDDVQVRRRVAHERVERVSVAPGVLAAAEQSDGLVTERPQELAHAVGCIGDLRDEDDPQHVVSRAGIGPTLLTISPPPANREKFVRTCP